MNENKIDMKYKDPYLGEIELTKLGEDSRSGFGEDVVNRIYVDSCNNYYIDTWTTTGGDKIPMQFLRKSLINKINRLSVKHYFVGDKIEVKNILRKQGNGKDVVINGVGIIKTISKHNDDIAYDVEFDIELEHSSPYGKKWTTNKNSFYIFHNEDKNNIINVF